MGAARETHRAVLLGDVAQCDPRREPLALLPICPVLLVLVPTDIAELFSAWWPVKQLRGPQLNHAGAGETSRPFAYGRVGEKLHDGAVADVGLIDLANNALIITRVPFASSECTCKVCFGAEVPAAIFESTADGSRGSVPQRLDAQLCRLVDTAELCVDLGEPVGQRLLHPVHPPWVL